MCNCSELPSLVGDPAESDSTFDFAGVEKHRVHFQELETESFDPKLDWQPRMYRCKSCQQWWYVECAPEEQPYPLFAIKCNSDTAPPAPVIREHKNHLCVLAHDGHEHSECRMSGCRNNKLKGRELCESHCSIF